MKIIRILTLSLIVAVALASQQRQGQGQLRPNNHGQQQSQGHAHQQQGHTHAGQQQGHNHQQQQGQGHVHQQQGQDDPKACRPCPCKGAGDKSVKTTAKAIEKCLKDRGYHNYFPVSRYSYHHTYKPNTWEYAAKQLKETLEGKDWGFLYCSYFGGGDGKEMKVFRHTAIACPTKEAYVRKGKRNTYELHKADVDETKPLPYGLCKPKVGSEFEACKYTGSGNCMQDGCMVIRWGSGNQDQSNDDRMYKCRQPRGVADFKGPRA